MCVCFVLFFICLFNIFLTVTWFLAKRFLQIIRSTLICHIWSIWFDIWGTWSLGFAWVENSMVIILTPQTQYLVTGLRRNLGFFGLHTNTSRFTNINSFYPKVFALSYYIHRVYIEPYVSYPYHFSLCYTEWPHFLSFFTCFSYFSIYLYSWVWGRM